MVEYGIPLLFLFFVVVVVPAGLLVAVFFTVRAVARWLLRRGIRFAVQERVRAERDLAHR